MVSFQCESCGDVLTKKKLDSHRNQCRGAVFTCLDCMITFKGTEYKAHTSCITEDQKYQGALYREKPSKAAKRKSVSILEPNDQNALVPHQAYVEDAPDTDGIEPPPHVPSPPSAIAKPADSVFDYMVDDENENTPRIAFAQSREEMAMKNGAPGLFSHNRASVANGYKSKEEARHTQDYAANGFTYGTEPIIPRPPLETANSVASLKFMTPAAKAAKTSLDKKDRYTPGHSRNNSGSEKKRKRGEEMPYELEGDTLMADAPGQVVRSVVDTPGIAHSGLTGGLHRMLSDDNAEYPFRRSASDEEDDRKRDRARTSRRSQKQEEPPSPLKRSRQSRDESGLGISIKGRAVKALSMVGDALLPGSHNESSTDKTRRRTSSSDHGQNTSRGRDGEKRDHKKHKVHRHNGTSSSNVRHEHRSRHRSSDESPDGSRRKQKTIEYKRHDESGSDSDDDRRRNGNGQLVVFGEEEKQQKRCEKFLANIPGTESDKGYSINKALKKWHKQSDIRSGSTKLDEEKELWRGLRLRKNDRGEIVVYFLK